MRGRERGGGGRAHRPLQLASAGLEEGDGGGCRGRKLGGGLGRRQAWVWGCWGLRYSHAQATVPRPCAPGSGCLAGPGTPDPQLLQRADWPSPASTPLCSRSPHAESADPVRGPGVKKWGGGEGGKGDKVREAWRGVRKNPTNHAAICLTPSGTWQSPEAPPPSPGQQPPSPPAGLRVPPATAAARPPPCPVPAQPPAACPALRCHPWRRIRTVC